ncbi:MAG TPA: hypothetical protein VJ818_09630 [Actinomycetota bacterium]|nr:hypothetical protein [Actinomycetota bacterium]
MARTPRLSVLAALLSAGVVASVVTPAAAVVANDGIVPAVVPVDATLIHAVAVAPRPTLVVRTPKKKPAVKPRALRKASVLSRHATPVARAAKPKPAPQPTSNGYDVSFPQCSSSLPKSPSFGIVGVNGGLAYSGNSCLASEYAWAQTSTSTTYPKASLYANTGNPGPAKSTHWPSSQSSPSACDGTWSAGCSYDYGWNAAADSFAKAAAVAGADGARAAYWWLDVETGNSWAKASDSSGWATLNTKDLQGAAAYLASQGVAQIGFYSTGYQWNQITGLTASTSPSYFSTSYVDWVPGATSLSGAQARCSSAYSFTGARVQLTQYIANNLDVDYRCF